MSDTRHGYLTTQLSVRLESSLLDHRLAHASYPFMTIITYCASQKKVASKPAASSQPPRPLHSEADPANVLDEPSGAQNNVGVRVHFVRLAAGAHNNFGSETIVVQS